MKSKIFTMLALTMFMLCVATTASARTDDPTTGTNSVIISQNNGFKIIKHTWTCSTLGNMTQAGVYVAGKIVKVISDPGTSAPTDDYDFTLTDSTGTDLLLGLAQDRDTANSEVIKFYGLSSIFTTVTLVQTVNTLVKVYPWKPICYGETTLTITTAGSEKSGVILIYVDERKD